MWVGLAIDIEEIERIEIIRGPGSTLYGAGAFAGVVNIVTMPDKPVRRSEVNLTAGEQGFLRLNGILREYWKIGDGELSLQAMLGTLSKHNPEDPAQLYQVPVRSHGVLRYRHQKDLDVSLHFGLGTGWGIWHTHVGDLSFEECRLIWVMARSDFSLSSIARLRAQAYYITNRGEFTSRTSLRAFDVWIADFPTFFVEFPVTDGQLQLDLQLADGFLLTTGANLRLMSADSSQFDPSHLEEIRAAGFVHAKWTLADMLQVTGGVRLDYSNQFDLAISPRIVLVFRPQDNHAFRAGYGLAFRKPSLYESQVHFLVESYNPATPEIIDKLRTSLGNEDLTNEKVHSIEAGWRAKFLSDRLLLTLDLYFNIYLDTIYFHVDLTENMGLPNIPDSTIRYENDSRNKHALGGELELAWKSNDNWQVWTNLGVRRVTWVDSGEQVPSEPTLRVNLGGRYTFSWGLYFDAALHYVSEHSFRFADPNNLLNDRELGQVGNNLLLIGRLGYRLPIDTERRIEAGLLVRTPLGEPFREYPGMRMPLTATRQTAANWGGDMIVRWVSVYLRGEI
jgi:iron complex outermembrane receptor protein